MWNNLPLETIARSYAGYHQFVNAIAECEGGDDSMRVRGGLHCGIRKHCAPYFASDESTIPSGVEMLESYDTNAGDEIEQRGLKCVDLATALYARLEAQGGVDPPAAGQPAAADDDGVDPPAAGWRTTVSIHQLLA